MKELVEIMGKISATATPEELERFCSLNSRQWQSRFSEKELMVIQQHVIQKHRTLAGKAQTG